jgi:hypothetical protein
MYRWDEIPNVTHRLSFGKPPRRPPARQFDKMKMIEEWETTQTP